MNVKKFEVPMDSTKKSMVEAALEGLRRVRASWLRDSAVVAVDVGYRLLHGKPIGPQVFNYYEKAKDSNGNEINGPRLSPEELAEKLGITVEEARAAAVEKISQTTLNSKNIRRRGYKLPWIRVHVDSKLTPEEVKEKKHRLYHHWPIEVDKWKFEIHVVQALYRPIQDDWDSAFSDLCDAMNGDYSNILRHDQRSSLSPEEQETLARSVALRHLRSAFDRRYGAPSVAGITVERDRPVDPLTGGVSIGTARQVGTLGAIVWDRTDCRPCILSCWHVLDGGETEVGERCLQPAVRDGGTVALNTVGWLKRSKVGRNVDAALADLNGSRGFSAGTVLCGPDGCGAINISGVSQVGPEQLLGTHVWKSGRTTGVTRGFIDGVGMSLSLEFRDGSSEIFHDQLHIVPDWPLEESGFEGFPVETEVSLAGDSGAIWLDNHNMAVGLNFAGDTTNSEMGDFAVANLMTDVEREMNISLTPVFRHPHELAENRRDSLLWGAIAELRRLQAADGVTPELARNLAEILSRVTGNLESLLGPIGQPETRPPGGGSGSGPIGQPQTWPPGGGSGAGAIGQPQTRPPGGGPRG